MRTLEVDQLLQRCRTGVADLRPRLASGTSGSAAAVTGNNRASHLQAAGISVENVVHGDRPRKLTRGEVALFTLLVILLSVLVYIDSSRSTSGVPILETCAGWGQ